MKRELASQEIHRQLPSSPEAEQGFLGSILITSYDSVMDEIPTKPRAASFHIPANQTIFKLLGVLADKKTPIDLIILTQELQKRELLDLVGGPSYIAHLFTVTPTAANVSYYAEIIEEKRVLREIIRIGTEAASLAYDSNGDSKQLLDMIESRVLQIGENNSSGCSTDLAVSEFIAQVEERQAGTYKGGLWTGIRPWDLIGGIGASRMYTLIARPGVGKTSMIEQVLINLLAAKDRVPVLVFQKDMPRDRFIGRLACRACGIPYFIYEKGRGLSNDQYEMIKEQARNFNDLPFYLYDPQHLTARDIHSIVRKEKRQHGVQAWFLDYIQLLSIDDREETSRSLTKASIELKACIAATKVPGVVVAQLNREGSKGKPSAAMIKEFDQLHADSGAIFILYSEADPHELEAGEPLPVQFLTDKNTYGPVSNSKLYFDRVKMTFRDKKHED